MKARIMASTSNMLSRVLNDEVSDTTGDCAKTENQKFMVIYQQVIKSGIKSIVLSV